MQLDKLKLISLCAYLTDVENQWRDEDHRASKMVKALKGDPIKGFFETKVAGRMKRFDQANVQEFLDRVPRAMARNMLRHYEGPATIVPIPNSHVVSPSTADFKTCELAGKIAAHSNGTFSVAPALVFGEAQDKARNGGPRDADYLENAYRIARKVRGPIILLDDVCTSGGHMIGAYRRLNGPESPVVMACAFGRSTRIQHEHPVGLRVEELDLG